MPPPERHNRRNPQRREVPLSWFDVLVGVIIMITVLGAAVALAKHFLSP